MSLTHLYLNVAIRVVAIRAAETETRGLVEAVVQLVTHSTRFRKVRVSPVESESDDILPPIWQLRCYLIVLLSYLRIIEDNKLIMYFSNE